MQNSPKPRSEVSYRLPSDITLHLNIIESFRLVTTLRFDRYNSISTKKDLVYIILVTTELTINNKQLISVHEQEEGNS